MASGSTSQYTLTAKDARPLLPPPLNFPLAHKHMFLFLCASHVCLMNAFPNLTEEHRSLVRRQLHALLEAGFTPLDYYTRDIRK